MNAVSIVFSHSVSWNDYQDLSNAVFRSGKSWLIGHAIIVSLSQISWILDLDSHFADCRANQCSVISYKTTKVSERSFVACRLLHRRWLRTTAGQVPQQDTTLSKTPWTQEFLLDHNYSVHLLTILQNVDICQRPKVPRVNSRTDMLLVRIHVLLSMNRKNAF